LRRLGDIHDRRQYLGDGHSLRRWPPGGRVGLAHRRVNVERVEYVSDHVRPIKAIAEQRHGKEIGLFIEAMIHVPTD
jgi:hypothetical protein